jgi:uncharacterized protein involved in exopolysaccharide biosynthesis
MSSDLTPQDIAQIVWGHKKKIFLCLLLSVAASLAVTAAMRPRYRSEAMLFVRLGRENVALDPTASMGAGAVVAVPQAREEEINSVVEILQSRALTEKLVDQFGAEALLYGESRTAAEFSREHVEPVAADRFALPQPIAQWWQRIVPDSGSNLREEAIRRVGQRLSAQAPKRSTVIHIAFDGPTPAIAQQVVDRLIELYLEEHVRLNRTPGTHDFFSEQTDELGQRLVDAETALRDLKNATGTASIEDQRLILVERIGRLEDDLLQTRSDLAACEAELDALDEKLDELPETRITQRTSGLPNLAADGMRQQLYTLQLKEQELLTTFQEETRQVKEIRRQIAEARAILAKEEYDRTQSTNGADPTYAQLHLTKHTKETLADSLRSRRETIEQQLADARQVLNGLNNTELKLVRLQRDVELAEANYRRYADNLEQARIDQALKLERISNISIAQRASLNTLRVRPDSLLNLMLGIFAGLSLGGIVVVISEHFRSGPAPPSRANRPAALPVADVEAIESLSARGRGRPGLAPS